MTPAQTVGKYRPSPTVRLAHRQWVDRELTVPPTWCSVDLRDGNQALAEPMNVERKLRLFDLLVEIGFTEIEVGFPAASSYDWDFIRRLIDEGRIPEGVTVQVLTQSRPELIDTTIAAIDGARCAIVHLYTSTSEQQRRLVFGLDVDGLTELTVEGARRCLDARELVGTDVTFEYSPESFTATEPDVAAAVCNAVLDVWKPDEAHPAIVNLPATGQALYSVAAETAGLAGWLLFDCGRDVQAQRMPDGGFARRSACR